MCKLIIKNIGPVKNIDLDVKRITIVIGPQSSGKSTIGKILCHCQWIEKRCYNNPKEEIKSQEENFLSGIEEYYRMEGYFSKQSYIKYEGALITLEYKDEKATITWNAEKAPTYLYPKLSYIPAARNFATMVPNLNKYNDSNDLLMYFIYDWNTARGYIKNVHLGDILQRQIDYSFDKSKGQEYIQDGEAKIRIQNASSGVQSLVPLYLVVSYILEDVYKRIQPISAEQKDQISHLLEDFIGFKGFTETLIKNNVGDFNVKQKTELMEKLKSLTENPLLPMLTDDIEGLQDRISRKFFYRFSSLFIEEAEQNLFPAAQEKLLYWIMTKLNREDAFHTAFLTTHSPYLLFALNNCVMGGLVGDKLPDEVKQDLMSRNSWISPDEVAMYQIEDGALKSIQDEDGLLSENYLNDAYARNSNEYLTMLTYL